jgi:WXG100 family type VII secretion target
MANGGDVGGKLPQMRDMAKDFKRNGEKLAEIIKALNGRTVSSNDIWRGPEAEQFRSEWNEARSSFQNMRDALDNAGKAVDKAAENLQEATRRR